MKRWLFPKQKFVVMVLADDFIHAFLVVNSQVQETLIYSHREDFRFFQDWFKKWAKYGVSLWFYTPKATYSVISKKEKDVIKDKIFCCYDLDSEREGIIFFDLTSFQKKCLLFCQKYHVSIQGSVNWIAECVRRSNQKKMVGCWKVINVHAVEGQTLSVFCKSNQILFVRSLKEGILKESLAEVTPYLKRFGYKGETIDLIDVSREECRDEITRKPLVKNRVNIPSVMTLWRSYKIIKACLYVLLFLLIILFLFIGIEFWSFLEKREELSLLAQQHVSLQAEVKEKDLSHLKFLADTIDLENRPNPLGCLEGLSRSCGQDCVMTILSWKSSPKEFLEMTVVFDSEKNLEDIQAKFMQKLQQELTDFEIITSKVATDQQSMDIILAQKSVS